MRNDYRVIIPILFSITESGAFREAKNGIILTKCDKKRRADRLVVLGWFLCFFDCFVRKKTNKTGWVILNNFPAFSSSVP